MYDRKSIKLLINSHWFCLTKSVAWLRKFVNWLADRCLNKANQLNSNALDSHNDTKGTLSVSELRDSELGIIQYSQNEKFAPELCCLQSPRGFIPKNSSIYRS